MEWQQYEDEIHQHFSREYPTARIVRNARIMGRYSKVERQIDLLIEDTIAGFHFRIVVDAKHRNRRADVTSVEAFIGFCSDVDAQRGVLISLKGHSQAARHRAYNDDSSIELDVLNFADLKQFQSHAAIPYVGSHGIFLKAPFGWIVDGTKRSEAVATLYQRGHDLESAARTKEWMYINFWAKDAVAPSLEGLIKHQESALRNEFPDATITYLDGPRRDNGATKIRRMVEKTYPSEEYTGFVEFDQFIFFCVLFTLHEDAPRNIRKLEYILRTIIPIKIERAAA